MITCSLLLITAVTIDAFLGDPAYPFHPVRLIGKSIQLLEPIFRKIPVPEFLQGAFFVLLVLGIWEGVLLGLFRLLSVAAPVVTLFALFVLYSSFALRDLTHHIHPVIRALEQGDMAGARENLQKIVGRDTAVLDRPGILRAAIETAAEGYVDGFLSPVFWFALFSVLGAALGKSPCLFGILGVLGYRIINTLDSMIGYKSEKYLYFGRFAARLDDWVNFVPARLSILFLFLAAWLTGKDAGKGLESVVKFRHCAASPNAGHPESFVAGAFHIRLGGPVQYPFGRVEKPFMGDGDQAPTPETLRQVTRLITLSGYLAAGIIALFLGFFPHIWKSF